MINMLRTDCKRIKDPIYGYISIDVSYVNNIIDTPIFQRLRRVLQTSYSPLYSSALHNRFVHSLGVYHLGTIVAKRLEESIEHDSRVAKAVPANLSRVYLLACLLHDIGHAPFSHTGEVFYKFYMQDGMEQVDAKELHNRLVDLVGSDELKKDIPGESGSAAAHEIMSAIIGIKEFGALIGNSEDLDFFARCITGYMYDKNTSYINQIRNCYICMLNSKVIDVDRLDYLIRDAYTSGFETINLDYNRLLNAITIKEYLDRPCLVYQKKAISVIENVVYAHDAERKWIQNHPVVLYEAYIIRHILNHIKECLDKTDSKLFSEESLSVAGHVLKDDIKISLLCDDDIIFLSKNMYSDKTSEELFNRNLRRHPVWKSEAEYKAYISNNMNEEENNLFTDCIQSFILSNNPEYTVSLEINDELLKKIEDELQKEKDPDKPSKATRRRYEMCKYLKRYSNERGFPFDYLVLPASLFTSNFSRGNLNKTLVSIDENKPVELHSVCSTLNAEKKDHSEMYYLYYRRGTPNGESEGRINDMKDFCQGLLDSSKID